MTDDRTFTHLDQNGAARMVDVGEKPVSLRTAVARAITCMQASTAAAIQDGGGKKGDVLQVARIAAISATKRTDELIPLCHSIPLDAVQVDFQWLAEAKLESRVTVRTTGKTGVEMEALVGASMAALTIYDMCKALDRAMRVESVELLEKTGGTKTDYKRDQQ